MRPTLKEATLYSGDESIQITKQTSSAILIRDYGEQEEPRSAEPNDAAMP